VGTTAVEDGPAASAVPHVDGPGDGRTYKRVLLKLSGQVFGGGSVGLDPDVVHGIARQIAEVARSGVQVAVVIGGGNFFRGAELQQRGMDRARADYMGMLGIVMNCLALQDFCEKQGVETRVQTAITMGQVAEPYIPTKLDSISYADALQRGLRVADATAFALCMENQMPMIVFGMQGDGNIARVLRGERIGTLVHG
jgi:uridylate kinase